MILITKLISAIILKFKSTIKLNKSLFKGTIGRMVFQMILMKCFCNRADLKRPTYLLNRLNSRKDIITNLQEQEKLQEEDRTIVKIP